MILALSWCVVLVLPGCLGGAGDGRAFLSPGDASAKVLSRATLGRGDVVLVPPRGYCIDAASVTDTMTGGFALIASCESLTGRFDLGSVEPAVMTVSVAARGTSAQPEAASLAATLGTARPLAQVNGDGLAIVQADDGADVSARDTRHWRGVMVVNGRILGLAVYGAKGSAVAGHAGQALLVAMAESIREQSPQEFPAQDAALRVDSATSGMAEPEPNARDTTQKTERAGPLRGILGRLFQ